MDRVYDRVVRRFCRRRVRASHSTSNEIEREVRRKANAFDFLSVFAASNGHGIAIETNNVAARTSTMLKWTCYAALSKNRASRPTSLDEREKRTDCGNASSRYLRIEKGCSCRSEDVEILRESSTKKSLGVRNIFESRSFVWESIARLQLAIASNRGPESLSHRTRPSFGSPVDRTLVARLFAMVTRDIV